MILIYVVLTHLKRLLIHSDLFRPIHSPTFDKLFIVIVFTISQPKASHYTFKPR